MKKLIFYLIMTIFMVSCCPGKCDGQTSPGVTVKSKPPQTIESLTKNCTKTNLLFKNEPIYKTPNGKYFVVKISKNNNAYRKWVDYKPGSLLSQPPIIRVRTIKYFSTNRLYSPTTFKPMRLPSIGRVPRVYSTTPARYNPPRLLLIKP